MFPPPGSRSCWASSLSSPSVSTAGKSRSRLSPGGCCRQRSFAGTERDRSVRLPRQRSEASGDYRRSPARARRIRQAMYTYGRNRGCRISLDYTYRGMQVALLENEMLEVGILVDKGADVFQF